MIELITSCCAFEHLHTVSLRCECGESIDVDTDNFDDVQHDYVIIKENISVTCPRCGKVHTPSNRYIPQEPQIIRETSQQSANSKRPYWTTRDITTDELLGTLFYD